MLLPGKVHDFPAELEAGVQVTQVKKHQAATFLLP